MAGLDAEITRIEAEEGGTNTSLDKVMAEMNLIVDEDPKKKQVSERSEAKRSEASEPRGRLERWISRNGCRRLRPLLN